MVKVTCRDDLQKWLDGKPREFAVLVAARSAMRAAPLLGIDGSIDARFRWAIVLQSCRAMAAASFSGTWPNNAANVAADVATATADAATAATAAVEESRSFANALSATAAVTSAASAAAAAYASAAAAVDFVTTAASTDAATEAGTTTALTWQAVTSDLQFLEIAFERDEKIPDTTVLLSSRPLWPRGKPGPFAARWSTLSLALKGAGEGWEVWTDWYEDRLRGTPPNLDLDKARAQIANEHWDKGPAHVNAIIKRLIEEHSSNSGWGRGGGWGVSAWGDNELEPEADGANIADVLASSEFRAALTDFAYDEEMHQMRMVPFVDEIPTLDDRQRKELETMLSELSDGMSDLARYLSKANVDEMLTDTAGVYAKEARRKLENVRPGRLWDLGGSLGFAAMDEYLRDSLTPMLLDYLERMVDKHRELMRLYLTKALERTRGLDRVEFKQDIGPESALTTMEGAVEDVLATDPKQLPAPDEEIETELRDRVEELRGILDRIERSSDAQIREGLAVWYMRKAKLLGVTLLRYRLRVAGVVIAAPVAGYSLAADIVTVNPEAWAKLLALFQKIPWPF